MKKQKNGVSAGNRSDLHESTSQNVSASKRASSISPPPAPVAFKKRKFMVDEEESEEEEEIGSGDENELIDGSCSRGLRRNLVKNLGDDFDRVASEVQEVNRSDSRNLRKKGSPFSDGSETVALRTRSRKLEEPNDFVIVMKVVEEVNNSNSKGKKLKAGKKSNNQVEESPNSVSSVRSSPRLANRRSG
ncbi:putative Microtubule-associated protein 6 [Quillaja saponaria]|uniref:Microtubule-associated protein 6 n=1 Tax=Quillaja saponaria TaxID=32244 RepID=A0AAD7QHA1_QUISA|nr:putative Microtubule-associated protein 6 [Quillaja saponaria]